MACKGPVPHKLFYDSIFPWIIPSLSSLATPRPRVLLQKKAHFFHILPFPDSLCSPLVQQEVGISLLCDALRVQEISAPWGHIQCPPLLQLQTHGDTHYRAKLISFLQPTLQNTIKKIYFPSDCETHTIRHIQKFQGARTCSVKADCLGILAVKFWQVFMKYVQTTTCQRPVHF